MSSFLRMESAPDLATSSARRPRFLHVVSASDPAVLLEIVRPAIGLAVWSREVAGHWAEDAASLLPFPLSPDGSDDRLADGEPAVLARALCSVLPGGAPDWFRRDVAWLSGLLPALAGGSRLVARFGAAPMPEPPKELRLVCRYGAGAMEWCHPGANGARLPGGALLPFAVSVLKGARSPELRERALLLSPDPRTAGPILSLDLA